MRNARWAALDIGSATPEETAVSIAAEIIQSRVGGSGLPLSRVDGAIHDGRSESGEDTLPRVMTWPRRPRQSANSQEDVR